MKKPFQFQLQYPHMQTHSDDDTIYVN